tara:strand:+ start:1974 stop:2987 length:1014 start_codon:yes stop_codon:yes gene_type:complete
MSTPKDLDFYQESINYLLDVQLEDGAISWEKDAKLDPWDHVESAMGLAIGGKIKESKRAFYWMRDNQETDGSWFSEYIDGKSSVTKKESNFIAYIFTGLWHNYLITKDKLFLNEMFETMDMAKNFILDLQTELGDFYWAKEDDKILDDSLITGCSSIYKSLECAEAIYKTLGKDHDDISKSKNSLKRSLIQNPERFDRNCLSKERFSMDWYYPVLCGVISGSEALSRINKKWDKFVVPSLGCRCVSDEPWVTVAESSELVLALLVLKDDKRAENLFNHLHQWKDKVDNLYWTGYVYTDKTFWPIEKPTWTASAVLLAADALYNFSPGSALFLKEWGS